MIKKAPPKKKRATPAEAAEARKVLGTAAVKALKDRMDKLWASGEWRPRYPLRSAGWRSLDDILYFLHPQDDWDTRERKRAAARKALRAAEELGFIEITGPSSHGPLWRYKDPRVAKALRDEIANASRRQARENAALQTLGLTTEGDGPYIQVTRRSVLRAACKFDNK